MDRSARRGVAGNVLTICGLDPVNSKVRHWAPPPSKASTDLGVGLIVWAPCPLIALFAVGFDF